MTFYQWLVLLHVLGAFGFVLAHGASASVVFRLRRERDLTRVRALLDLSSSTLYAFYAAALVMLVSGIWAGIEGGWFTNDTFWIWAAVGVLVLVAVLMYLLISRHYYRWRELLTEGTPESEAQVVEGLANPQPTWGAVIGLVGLLVIVWLMVAKPF